MSRRTRCTKKNAEKCDTQQVAHKASNPNLSTPCFKLEPEVVNISPSIRGMCLAQKHQLRSESRQPKQQELNSLFLNEKREESGFDENIDAERRTRTVHLRFLPTSMLQGDLAALCASCGKYLRVRICGNSSNAQRWIFGFVEFADRCGAEAMMRRSGMELPNGAGKKPLRLNCTAAKEGIVDRLFHDADPASHAECLFGRGSFAQCTLKEALDSYHNLKKRGNENDTLKGNFVNASLHACNTNQQQQQQLSSSLPPPTVQEALASSSSSSLSIPCQIIKVKTSQTSSSFFVPTPIRLQSQSTANSDEESAGITPHLYVPVVQDNRCVIGDVTLPPSLYTESRVEQQHGYLINNKERCVESSNKTDMLNGLKAQQIFHSRIVPFPDTHTYPLPLFNLSKEQVLGRGQALIIQALKCAQQFVWSGEFFYDAVGKLSYLLKILRPFLQCITDSYIIAAEYEASDLLQRSMQLTLLAYLILVFLYICKNDTDSMLQTIYSVVTFCDQIPSTRLQKPLSFYPHSTDTVKRVPLSQESSSTEVVDHVVYTNASFPDDLSSEVSSTFNPLCSALNFLDGFDTVCVDETEASVIRAAMSVLSAEDQDSAPDINVAQMERLYQRDVMFQSYILNVLLSIGLATELEHIVVTQSLFSLVHQRAKDVFGSSLPQLEQALREGGMHCLRRFLFPHMDAMSFVHKLILFFDTEKVVSWEEFWEELPPYPIMRVFPVAGV